jgi:hypothetical protein
MRKFIKKDTYINIKKLTEFNDTAAEPNQFGPGAKEVTDHADV